MKKIRILLADDHSIMRVGLASLLSREKDMTVAGEAETGEEAVALARELKPDVVVMDLMMPVLSGAEATRQITAGSAPGADVRRKRVRKCSCSRHTERPPTWRGPF